MSNVNTIFYSIIIPHKNTPDLLQYCLDSIPVRDDVQVIVVDDNSDADKMDFDYFPQWKGCHYEYYLTKEGKGAGYARNVGLKHAEGKWVLFVDADDFLSPLVNEVFDEEKGTDADIVFFRPKAVKLEDRITVSKRADAYNAILDRYCQNDDETELRCCWFSSWSRFFRLEMIRNNDIRFDEIRYSNDNLFAVKSGTQALKIVVRDKSYYCITESGNSLTSNFMKKPDELQIRIDAFFRVQKVVYEHGYPVDEALVMDYLRLLFSGDRDAFVMNFNRMREMGYNRMMLMRELFKNNRLVSRIKRTAYVSLKTVF